jgi:rRNA-processing protein FCF1
MNMKIVHAQTVLPEHVLEELKKKSGEDATKEAIAKAVEHYLKCSYTEEPLEKRLERALKRRETSSEKVIKR